MARRIFVTSSLFDGERYRSRSPHTVVIEGGRVTEVAEGDHSLALARPGDEVEHVAFLMPGLVEGHAHLFLDGGELDISARSAYRKTPFEGMLAVGRDNLARAAAAGVTLVRDAGDRYGVNHALRDEAMTTPGLVRPRVRSAGLGVRAPRRYGAFMAREVTEPSHIAETVLELAQDSDDIKVILTGIVDFDLAAVKGAPQFDLDGCRTIVASAKGAGRRTLAHCSGADGLALAIDAGFDSIEHGYFMHEEALVAMAKKGITWSPTFSPVDFQWRAPQWCGWSERTLGHLRKILDDHAHQVTLAAELGVPLVCGSDAGSQGVRHGSSLVDEIEFLIEAGLGMEAALAAATSVPRRLWGELPAGPTVGARAELVVLEDSPFVDQSALRRVAAVVIGDCVLRPEPGTTCSQERDTRNFASPISTARF